MSILPFFLIRKFRIFLSLTHLNIAQNIAYQLNESLHLRESGYSEQRNYEIHSLWLMHSATNILRAMASSLRSGKFALQNHAAYIGVCILCKICKEKVCLLGNCHLHHCQTPSSNQLQRISGSQNSSAV